MTHLNHITLATGHNRRSPRAEVSGDTIKMLTPWLAKALAHDGAYPLPGPLGAEGYRADLSVEHGALLCTLSVDPARPLLTFGVAARSRQSGELWAMMCAQFGAADALVAPGTPWCAVALHPEIASRPDALGWAADFERSMAWAWIENAQ